jgi:hypothetical protein
VRRILSLVVAGGICASMFALAAPAGAQTGDIAALCAARLESNGAETKAENVAILEKAVAAAPSEIAGALTELRDGVKKKGTKYFETAAGGQVATTVDAYLYENCAGTDVPVTAIDYEFDGVPATLPAGTTKIQLTNDAPKEMHEMALFKLTDEGAAMDPEALLALPQKKAEKFVDFSSSAFAFAPPGVTGYAFADLQAGDYLYACFIPTGGKKNGKPHFTQGMYGTLTVS